MKLGLRPPFLSPFLISAVATSVLGFGLGVVATRCEGGPCALLPGISELAWVTAAFILAGLLLNARPDMSRSRKKPHGRADHFFYSLHSATLLHVGASWFGAETLELLRRAGHITVGLVALGAVLAFFTRPNPEPTEEGAGEEPAPAAEPGEQPS